MDNLLNITIDPSVLVTPHVNCTNEEVLQYIRTLLVWGNLLNKSWITVRISEQASSVLASEQLYPRRTDIGELFNRHGIANLYSINDVASVIDKLLRYTPSFEAYYDVSHVRCKQTETIPDISRLMVRDGLQSNLERCVTLIAVLCKYCSQPLGGHSLIFKKAPNLEIKIRTQIDYMDHSNNDIPSLPSPPNIFEGIVLTCDNFNGLIEHLNASKIASAILVGATDNLDVEHAIRIALLKHAIEQRESIDWNRVDISKLRIGSKLREKYQKICAEQIPSLPSKILRSVVKTIKGDDLSSVHALRTGPGGNDPQQMRNSDKAQRRDIDDEFRLHYWECDDGKIELASVNYHNDFSIPR